MKAAKLLVGLALLVAGCSPASPAAPAPSPSGERPITRLTVFFGPGDFPRSGHMEITTDGVRSRTRQLGGSAADELTMFNASDGTTQVLCDSTGCRRHEVSTTAASKAAESERECPNRKQTGTGEFVGRRTTIWSCSPEGGEQNEVVYDAEFPDVMLKGTLTAGYQVEAESFEVGVDVPEDFFDLDRPGLTWAKPKPATVKPPKPGKSGAVLPAPGGGELRMTDYTNGPAVIVVGGEDQARWALTRIRRAVTDRPPTMVAVIQLRHDGTGAPTEPLDVPVGLNPDDGKVWQDMTAGQVWPVAVFCRAAAKGCTAISMTTLSDEQLAAEVAKVA